MTENITQPIYRLAVISDIHGMLPTLETVLAKIMVDPPDAIIVAGDIVGGPQPHETLALLREYNCRMILGNGEDNMLSMYRGTAPDAWWTERQFDFARWVYRHLEEEDFAYLAKLPEQLKFEVEGAEPIRVVHGSPRDINKLMLPKKEPDIIQKALEMIDENYLIFGHTHTPGIYRHNGKLAVNPGALSNNLVGVPEISYAIFVWDGQVWNPEIFKSEPDFDQLKQSFIKTGFLQATFPLGRTFLESIFTGANTTVDFILHAVGLAKKDGLAEFNTIPDKYWLEAAKSFPWQFDL
jgi:putative phosphoesterase